MNYVTYVYKFKQMFTRFRKKNNNIDLIGLKIYDSLSRVYDWLVDLVKNNNLFIVLRGKIKIQFYKININSFISGKKYIILKITANMRK